MHNNGQDADVKIAAAAMHGIFCYSAGVDGNDLSQYSLSLSLALPQRLLLACGRVTDSVSRADVLQLAHITRSPSRYLSVRGVNVQA
jgi:F420-0:gamma-glutamyl ligase